MGVGILAKRVVLELGFSTNFVYSLKQPHSGCFFVKKPTGCIEKDAIFTADILDFEFVF